MPESPIRYKQIYPYTRFDLDSNTWRNQWGSAKPQVFGVGFREESRFISSSWVARACLDPRVPMSYTQMIFPTWEKAMQWVASCLEVTPEINWQSMQPGSILR